MYFPLFIFFSFFFFFLFFFHYQNLLLIFIKLLVGLKSNGSGTFFDSFINGRYFEKLFQVFDKLVEARKKIGPISENEIATTNINDPNYNQYICLYACHQAMKALFSFFSPFVKQSLFDQLSKSPQTFDIQDLLVKTRKV